jgi:hypothetical protein
MRRKARRRAHADVSPFIATTERCPYHRSERTLPVGRHVRKSCKQMVSADTTFDETRRDVMAERLLSSCLGMFDVFGAYLGDRLGL